MQDDFKNILISGTNQINDQQLMDYLNNRLSKSKVHDLEKEMADDSFINDAVEGLQQLNSQSDIQQSVTQLNQVLQQQVIRNRQRREKRRWKDQPYLYLIILSVILLLLTGAFVILKTLR